MPSIEENRRWLEQESDAGDYHETTERFDATLTLVADLLAALEGLVGIETMRAEMGFEDREATVYKVEKARAAIAAAHQASSGEDKAGEGRGPQPKRSPDGIIADLLAALGRIAYRAKDLSEAEDIAIAAIAAAQGEGT